MEEYTRLLVFLLIPPLSLVENISFSDIKHKPIKNVTYHDVIPTSMQRRFYILSLGML